MVVPIKNTLFPINNDHYSKIKEVLKMAKNNEAIAKRFAKKAQSLLARRGGKLRFIGGTALDQTTLTGMESILRAVSSIKDREMLAEATSQCLRAVPHDWTVIYGFIHYEGMEDGLERYGVECDSLDITQANSHEMTLAANYAMAQEFREQPIDTRLGQVWMAIPKTLPDQADEIDYINELLQWMAEVNFFDREHMRNRLALIAASDVQETIERVDSLAEA